MVSDALASRRLNLQLLGAFAAVALVLAAVGIYGVMAYSVSRRSNEIGIRMALGAAQSNIVSMVVGKAVLLGGLGVLLGWAAALAVPRLLARMLSGIKPADPLTFLAVGLILFLFLIALAASFGPARRATRVSPNTALRSE